MWPGWSLRRSRRCSWARFARVEKFGKLEVTEGRREEASFRREH
jgi:hypothetical protein